MNWLHLLLASSGIIGPQGAGDPARSILARLVQTGTTTLPTTPTAVAEPFVTPVVVPTLPPAGQLNGNPLSLDHLTSAAQPPLGPFGIGFALLGLILLAGGLYYYFVVKDRWKRSHALKYQTANFWSIVGITLGGLTLLFTLFRLLNFGGLNARFWFYLLGLVVLLAGAYAAYFFTQSYPKQLAAYAKRQGGTRGGKATVRTRTPAGTTRTPAAPGETAAPIVPKGDPGNPRGTSPRGDRRRTKR